MLIESTFELSSSRSNVDHLHDVLLDCCFVNNAFSYTHTIYWTIIFNFSFTNTFFVFKCLVLEFCGYALVFSFLSLAYISVKFWSYRCWEFYKKCQIFESAYSQILETFFPMLFLSWHKKSGCNSKHDFYFICQNCYFAHI